jgi:hypothetical protein
MPSPKQRTNVPTEVARRWTQNFLLSNQRTKPSPRMVGNSEVMTLEEARAPYFMGIRPRSLPIEF